MFALPQTLICLSTAMQCGRSARAATVSRGIGRVKMEIMGVAELCAAGRCCPAASGERGATRPVSIEELRGSSRGPLPRPKQSAV